MGDESIIIFRVMGVNRCIQKGVDSNFVVYRREGDGLRLVPFTIDNGQVTLETFVESISGTSPTTSSSSSDSEIQ